MVKWILLANMKTNISQFQIFIMPIDKHTSMTSTKHLNKDYKWTLIRDQNGG